MEEIGTFGSEVQAIAWCQERGLSPYDYQLDHRGGGVRLWVDRAALNGELRRYGQFDDR